MNTNTKLKGMIVYCMLDKPNPCYDAEKGFEYKCGVVVSEDEADAFAEKYPKQAARKVKRADFEGIYKVAPPEGTEKNLYIITLKKNAHYKDKNTGENTPIPPKYRPRVLRKEGSTLVDLTNTVKPANGSYGIVSFDEGETRYGPVARLRNVLIEELIEYEGGEEYNPGDEFADDGEGEVKVPAKAIQKAKAKATSKPVEEDDLPF